MIIPHEKMYKTESTTTGYQMRCMKKKTNYFIQRTLGGGVNKLKITSF